MKRLILIFAIVALVVSAGQAAVLVDFGKPAVPDVPETDGRIYNYREKGWAVQDPNVPDPNNPTDYVGTWGPMVEYVEGAYVPAGPLVDENGAGTSVQIETLGMDGWLGQTTSYYLTVFPAYVDNTGYPDNVTDGIGNKTYTPLGVRWINVPDGLYTVKLSGHYVSQGWPVDYTLQGDKITTTGGDHTTQVWADVSPIGGILQIDIATYGNSFFTVAELIPEPATMSLLALGGLVMLRRRR